MARACDSSNAKVKQIFRSISQARRHHTKDPRGCSRCSLSPSTGRPSSTSSPTRPFRHYLRSNSGQDRSISFGQDVLLNGVLLAHSLVSPTTNDFLPEPRFQTISTSSGSRTCDLPNSHAAVSRHAPNRRTVPLSAGICRSQNRRRAQARQAQDRSDRPPR